MLLSQAVARWAKEEGGHATVPVEKALVREWSSNGRVGRRSSKTGQVVARPALQV